MKIFVTTGSRSFPFDRLVRAVDNTDFASVLPVMSNVFIQTGSSTYIPKHAAWSGYLSRDEFSRRMNEADLVISHGGTGAIINAVKRGKRVVAVPRLSEFGEAVDDHQIELVRQFEAMGLIKGCFDLNNLAQDVAEALQAEYKPYKSNTESIIQSIELFIQEDVVARRKRGVQRRTKEDGGRKLLVISNMWPDKKHPSSGVFVKKFVDQAESLGWNCKLAVMRSSDGLVSKALRYLGFYVSSFAKTLFCTCDAVYIHYPSFSAPAALAALHLRKRRLIVNVHGSDVLPVSSRQEKMHRFTRDAVVMADKVVAPSDYFARIVMEKYGIDSRKTYVYPSGGIDLDIFHPLPSSRVQEIKDELGLDGDALTLCFAGRITEGKGWDTYLQAVAQVLAKGRHLNAILVGSGDQDAQCEELIHVLGLTGTIVRMGLQSQDRLCELYNAADVFAFPGRRSESLGLVAVEAMACGTPVIASDFAAPKYYIENNVNGIKVPVGDVTALAETIEGLSKNPERICVMREGALRTAARFSTSRIRQDLSSVLEWQRLGGTSD